MSGTLIALGVLGVWRLTHLLHAENGPGDAVAALRRALGASVAGRAMDCFDCLSLWVAMPFAAALGASWRETALVWPALSAAAMILNRGVSRLRQPADAVYAEDPPGEVADVQLRQGERGDDAGTAAGGANGRASLPLQAGGVVDHLF